MFGPVLWRGVIPVTVFLLGAGSALADNAVPPDTVDRAYGVLERMGLLQQEAPAAPAAASAPRAADAAAASTSAAMPQESPARAYGVLERHGLLPKQEAPVRGVASAPASAGSAAPATASAPTDVAPPPAAAALAASPSAPTAVAAATAPAPERSRFSAGALGMLERLGLVQKQAPGAAPADAVTPGAAAAAPAAAGGLAEEEVRPDAPATTVAGSTAVETQVASHAAAEPPSYQVLRRLGLLKPLPGAAAVPMASAGPRVDRVVVEKSKRRLYLMRNGQTYREYPIALGLMPRGPKVQAGDLRTPEGVYTLDWRNPKSRFYKAIHISYPSAADRLRAEEKGVDPGGMVMIHGEHDEPSMRRILRRKPKDWTEGCIALNNEHMDELWQTVPVGTPIEIKP